MPKPGYLTPSTFPDLMQKGKLGPFGTAAIRVIQRHALDLIGVEQVDQATSPALEHGIAYEFIAIGEYEDKFMREVIAPVKFQAADDLEYVGGTMDGLIAPDGGVEFKCPYNPVNHMLKQEHFKRYEWQIHGYMWVFNRQWIDFVSYDPRYPEDLQLITHRVERDEQKIAEMKDRCTAAHIEALRMAEQLAAEASQ